MAALWRKASAEMAAGSWLVSNTFAVPDVAPQQLIEMQDWRQSRLLLWQMPGAPLGAGDTGLQEGC